MRIENGTLKPSFLITGGLEKTNEASHMDGNENDDGGERQVSTGGDTGMRTGKIDVSPFEITHSDHLAKCDPGIYRLLESDEDIEIVRKNLFSLLIDREIVLFSESCGLDDLERSNALNCIKILKNLIAPRNEKLSGHSILKNMVGTVRERPGPIEEGSRAAYMDFLYIALGSLGRSNIYREENLALPNFEGRKGAIVRSDYLDDLAEKCMNRIELIPFRARRRCRCPEGGEPAEDT